MASRNPFRPFVPDAFFAVFSDIATAWIDGT
jgi:hypothetical protein